MMDDIEKWLDYDDEVSDWFLGLKRILNVTDQSGTGASLQCKERDLSVPTER